MQSNPSSAIERNMVGHLQTFAGPNYETLLLEVVNQARGPFPAYGLFTLLHSGQKFQFLAHF